MQESVPAADHRESIDQRASALEHAKHAFFRAFPNLTQFVIALFTACNFFLFLYLYTMPDPSVAKRMPTYLDGHLIPLKLLNPLGGNKFEGIIRGTTMHFNIVNMEADVSEDRLVIVVINRDHPTGYACFRAKYKWGPSSVSTPIEGKIDLTVGDSVGFLLAAKSDNEVHWLDEESQAGRRYERNGTCNYGRLRRGEGKIEFRPFPWTETPRTGERR